MNLTNIMKRTNPNYSTTVVEEKSSEIVEYGTQEVLKLKRPRHTLDASKRLAFELSQYCTQQEILHILIDLEKEIPLESLEETEFLLRTLWERLYEMKDSVVRVKIISLLGRVAKYPGVNVLSVAEDLIKLLPLVDSHKVTAQIFHTLMILGKLFSSETKIVHQIEKIATQHLKDSHFLVRCQCLQLIGHLSQGSDNLSVRVGQDAGVDGGGVQGLLATFMADSDPRVRTNVLQALLTLHERGQTLDIAVYEQASRALDDDYEDVRLVAVKLVWVFGLMTPDRIVLLPSSDKVCLVDDAFIKICHMVNDLSMSIRKEATSLLGSLHHVSPKFLEQTLDKKLMSHLKRRKTDHEKRKDRHAAGGADEGWSTGRAWGDKAPEIEIDPEDVSIISSGTCGAFVHSLEDEFMEVRTAAVDSLCELANQNPPFAVLSLDFLADMMNDEIESVRLNAINSLGKISRHIQLREDQLETLLGVLEDFSGDTREAVRELLCHCVLSTRACLHAAIHALLGNLAKYPQDRSSIWRCARFLGEKHQHLASSLVPELLSTHPFFATPEPSIDDPAYVTILILVFNATAKSVTMLAMFPNHTCRHYVYLRDSQPELVPHLDVDKAVMLDWEDSRMSEEEESQSTKCFLEKIQERILRVSSQKPLIAQQALKTAIQDLQHIKSIDSHLSANAECLSLYLQCQLRLLKAQNDNLWDIPAALCTHEASGVKALVEGILMSSYQIEHTFVGFCPQHIFLLKSLRLIAHALQILFSQRYSSSNDRNLNSMLQVWESFLTRIKIFSNFLNVQNINADEFTAAVVSFPSFFESNITNPSGVVEYIQSIILSHKVAPLELTGDLYQARATLNEPRGGSDNPLCFYAGLTLGINVEAMLENVTDPSNVRVQAVFPDLRRQWFIPKHDDFHSLLPTKRKLTTTVIISHSGWSEPGFIELSLVLKYTPDVDEESVLNLGSSCSLTDGESKILKRTRNSTDNLIDGVVNLCAPVSLCIMSKGTR